jgi:hypothetical protein
MNIEVVCAALPCLLSVPLDGASPRGKKGVLTRPTSARGEPPCQSCRAVPSCPVLPVPWISARTCGVSVATRLSPSPPSRLVPRSCLGSWARQSAQPWGKHWRAALSMSRRSRAQERGPSAAYGVPRPLPGPGALDGARGACLDVHMARLRGALVHCAPGAARAPGPRWRRSRPPGGARL